jgi:hypothetical protein
MSAPATAPRTTPLAVRPLVAIAVAGVVASGAFVVVGLLAPGYYSSIGLGIGWFFVASFAIRRLTRRRPELRVWARGAFLLTAAAAAFAFWWTSIRETEVNERIATGTKASELRTQEGRDGRGARRPAVDVELFAGEVDSLAHSAEGRAAIVELASGGRRLTLDDFDIDPGPEVVVRLVPRGADEGTDDHRELGDLKGSKGNQQYRVPESVDLSRYSTVVFWCVPFTQALAKADLRPS